MFYAEEDIFNCAKGSLTSLWEDLGWFEFQFDLLSEKHSCKEQPPLGSSSFLVLIKTKQNILWGAEKHGHCGDCSDTEEEFNIQEECDGCPKNVIKCSSSPWAQSDIFSLFFFFGPTSSPNCLNFVS